MFAPIGRTTAGGKRKRAETQTLGASGAPTTAAAATSLEAVLGNPGLTPKAPVYKRARHFDPPAEPEKEVSSFVIQFKAQGAEDATGPTMDVPSDVTTEQLELLINQVLEAGDEPTPYAFYLNDVELTGDLQSTIDALSLSAEAVHVIRYQPLATFRVQPATRCTDTLPGHEKAVLHVSFSPDGSILASGGGDNTVRFWDSSTCTPTHLCEGHNNHVLATAWSSDGHRFASADKSGEVRIWNPKTGKEACKPLTGHSAWVTSMAWEPHHTCAGNLNKRVELLATASKDKTVRIWNTRTGIAQIVLSGHADSIESVRWGGEGLIYTASRDKTVMVWALDAERTRAKIVRTLSGHGHRINALALNTDSLCRAGAFDHRGNVFTSDSESESAEHLRPSKLKRSSRYCCFAVFEGAVKRYREGFAKMGGKELLVSCSDDFTMFLWDPIDTKKAVVRMTGHQDIVNHLSFSPDGRYIASASFDKKVKIWDGRTGKFLANFFGHVGRAYQVCWSSDSRYIASASKDSTVKIWSSKLSASEKPRALETLSGHYDEVYALDWSPNGEMVASGSKDRTIKM